MYPAGQSVSPHSERIPSKCTFPCACGWQEGQAEAVFCILLWSCCLWLLPAPLEEFVSKKSHCLCVPRSGDDFHRNWSAADGGGRQRKVTTSPLKKGGCQAKPQTSASVRNWQLCLQDSAVLHECVLEQQGFGAASSHAMIAGESVSCLWRRLSPCTETCLHLLVWNNTDRRCCLSVFTWQMGWSDGFQYTRSTSIHFLMGFHFPQRFSLLLSSKQNLKNDTAFFLLSPSLCPKGWKQWCCRQRQGYCLGARQLHVQEFRVLTEFNPLEPVEHMAKQLLPIYVLQQLPLALAAAALPQHQLLGTPGGKKGVFILCAPTHSRSSALPACGSLASWEALLQVIKRAPTFGVLGKCTGVSVSGCFRIEGEIQMFFLL